MNTVAVLYVSLSLIAQAAPPQGQLTASIPAVQNSFVEVPAPHVAKTHRDLAAIRAEAMQRFTPEFRKEYATVLNSVTEDILAIKSESNPNRTQLFDSTGKPFIEDLNAEADDDISDILTQAEFEARMGTAMVDKD